MMPSGLQHYIAEYTVANFRRYPIRRRAKFISAFEFNITLFDVISTINTTLLCMMRYGKNTSVLFYSIL